MDKAVLDNYDDSHSLTPRAHVPPRRPRQQCVNVRYRDLLLLAHLADRADLRQEGEMRGHGAV